jgi:FkbM family methyltransferase
MSQRAATSAHALDLAVMRSARRAIPHVARTAGRVSRWSWRLAAALDPALLVDEPWQCVKHELRRSGELRSYRVRGSDAIVCIRHGTRDLDVLNEIFRDRIYAFPPEVVRVLGSRSEPAKVVDLGGNIGLFGAWLTAALPEHELVVYEPDPGNAEVLSRCITANNNGDRWRAVQACASNADGSARFLSGEHWGSRVVTDDEEATGTVRVVDVFPDLEGASFAKIDIEGGEWSILMDPRFECLSLPVIAMEYHPWLCPEPDARALATERLVAAGYEVRGVFHDDEAGHGMVWAWKDGA